MVILERGQRSGPVLTPSSLPCLRGIPTVNITNGCAHACSYCYTRGYSGYPGEGRVIVFDNIPDLVQAELLRKRRRPGRVYFSPSSDAFQPLREVQDVTYKTMSILLNSGVDVAFLTKGAIEDRFMALFSASPTKVFAQVGITTLEERLRQALEAGAASITQRLKVMEDLAQIGVEVRARLDPLIPGLTDTESSLSSLLAELIRRGVRRVAASYLFLRPAFSQRICERLCGFPGWPRSAATWPWHRLADGVGGGQMISLNERRQGFRRLEALAEEHGVSVHVCACKNPDLGLTSDCGIAGPASARTPDAPLFGSVHLDRDAGT